MIRRFCDWCSENMGNATDDYASISYPLTFSESEDRNDDDICLGCFDQFQQLIKVRKEKSANDQRKVPR